MALHKVVQAAKHLEAGGQRFVGHGFNDTVVFPLKCLYVKTMTGDNLNKNNLFPTTPVGLIPATTLDEFWWKYTWLANHFGINLIRSSNCWGYAVMLDSFYNNRAGWDKNMASMLKMARWNQVYISFGLGSPPVYDAKKSSETDAQFAARVAAWEADNAYKLDSQKYWEYVNLQKAIVSLHPNEPAILCWEIANEPDGDGPHNVWWHKQPNQEQAWHDWSNRICNDIMPSDPTHLFTMGTAAGALMHGYGEQNFKDANDHPCQITHQHIYGRRISFDYDSVNDYFAKMRKWSDDLGKPCFMGEYGYSCWQPGPDGVYRYYLPVEYGGGQTQYQSIYSKWDTQVLYETDHDLMTSMTIPYYPNWPPSQALMDSIPPVPSSDPNPVDAAAYEDFTSRLAANFFISRR